MLNFVCHFCGEKFKSEDELKDHLREYHRIEKIEREMIEYELDECVKKSLEKILGGSVSIQSVGRNYVDLRVSVAAQNIPLFWEEVSSVLRKLVELGWYPEYTGGDFESYMMEWHAVVSARLDEVIENARLDC